MEETTHVAPNIRGRKRTIEVERLNLDAAKNVGAPTSQSERDSHLTNLLDTWL